MIKQLTIRNFQSHKDTTLDLDPGVNLIVGQSDSGKTAIFRALKWLVTNRPSGESFRSSWGGDTEVMLALDDGKVFRLKGKKASHYILNGAEPFTALGTEVPESIAQALNINELSWQAQMDPPFLLSASPGEVARTLNEVADLDKIDTTLVNINRMAKDNRTALVTAAQLKQELELDLSKYRGLDDRMKRIKQFHEMEKKAQLLEEMVNNGGRILEEIKEQQEELSHVKETADADEELDLLMDMVGRLKDIEATEEKMVKQVTDILKAEAYLKHVSEMLVRLEEQWHESSKGRCPLCGRSA
jgi:exonuclease SbcC